MKILYLHQYFVPPDGPGITRSYEFARRLIANHHEVTMITSTGMLPERYQTIDATCEMEIAGIPAVVIPVPYSNHMSFDQRIRAFLNFALLASREAMRHPADVIFATSTPLTIAIPGIAAHLWQRKPMVFEVRDLWPELPIQMGALRNPLARAAAYGLEWLAYHSAKRLIALSPGIEQGIERMHIPSQRIMIIPNSCDTDLFDVPAERGQPIRDQLNLRPDQPLILYAGTFGMLNGVDYLVDVAAAMRAIAPDVRFLIIGSGKEQQKIVDKARALGVLDETLWVWEPVPKEKVPEIFAAATAATVLFLPLESIWRTNSANKFFDALAAGKPVLVNYPKGWQADLVRETGAGLILSPDDPQQAARDLAAFLQNPAELQRAAQAAHDLAYQRFHRDAMASKLEAVLRQVGEGS